MSRTIVIAMVLAAGSLAATAAPIFTDTFTNGSTVGGASVPGGTPSASTTSYDIASTRNSSSSAISSGVLSVVIPATTSAFSEAQAIFTSSPVVLTDVNDWIKLQYVFTASANVMTGTGMGNTSQLWTGLYSSASSLPLTTLANSGLTSTATSGAILTAGAAPWRGFVQRIAATGTNGAGTSSIYTRPAQTTGTSSAVQDLLGNGVGSGAFNGPTGVTLRTLSGSAAPALTVGQQYTVDYTLTLLGTGTLGISTGLFSGSGTGGSLLFAASGTASGVNLLTSTFDGLAIGYRYNGGSAASSLNINSIAVTSNLVPEPASLGAATLSGAAMAMLVYRRRRREAAQTAA